MVSRRDAAFDGTHKDLAVNVSSILVLSDDDQVILPRRASTLALRRWLRS